MTIVRQVQGLGVQRAAEWSAQSVSELFFKDGGHRHPAHAGGAGNRPLGESFQVQFFDGCLFVRTLLFFGIKRAIRITVFTVKFLLATWCMTIFVQVDGVTAAAPYGNHARFLSLSGTTWHDTIYQSLLDHYRILEIMDELLSRYLLRE